MCSDFVEADVVWLDLHFAQYLNRNTYNESSCVAFWLVAQHFLRQNHWTKVMLARIDQSWHSLPMPDYNFCAFCLHSRWSIMSGDDEWNGKHTFALQIRYCPRNAIFISPRLKDFLWYSISSSFRMAVVCQWSTVTRFDDLKNLPI